MKITFVGKIDPYDPVPCGIRGYFYGLLEPYSKMNLHIKLIGASQKRSSDNDKFQFINVLNHYSKSQSLFIIALYLKTIFYRATGFFSNDDIFHIQRIDQAFPFVIFKKQPVICTFHGKGSEQAMDKYGKFIYTIYNLVEGFVASRLDFAIAVSDDIYDFYSNRNKQLSDKMVVINNGVDLSRFKKQDKVNCRIRYGLDPQENIILYLGRFHEEKNLPFLINVFNGLIKNHSLDKTKLLLVGDGMARSQLKDLAIQLKIDDRIIFMDPVPDSDVPGILGCADVFALPSRVEGFPLVLLQSLACGVPIVSTNVGAASKVVIDNKTGFIVNDFSEKQFTDKLKYVIANSDDFSLNCITLASQYSWDEVAKKNMDIYKKFSKVVRN